MDKYIIIYIYINHLLVELHPEAMFIQGPTFVSETLSLILLQIAAAAAHARNPTRYNII